MAMRMDALIMEGGYLALGVGVRATLQRIRTGSFGMVGLRAMRSRQEVAVLTIGVLVVAAFALAMLHPPSPVFAASPQLLSAVQHAGLAVFGLGTLATFLAQLSMGDSWRIGVPKNESTRLVTGGPFRWVRNPIYTSMLGAELGVVGVLANGDGLIGWLLLALALQIQVRGVEEPFLRTVHGEAYRAYGMRVGRFLPGLGLQSTR